MVAVDERPFHLHAGFAVFSQAELNNACLPGLFKQLDHTHAADAHALGGLLLGDAFEVVVPRCLRHQHLFVIVHAPSISQNICVSHG
ncbi:hypothetical protein SDC9_125613 [bioreactor metagenome]|uniref:Uncharacterized protein n=1 Tax=bioreactor metagenome TaxID=1076179 RepID=A0A645CPB5_9ZZZZ